jgi:single-strand DNA-binding protein
MLNLTVIGNLGNDPELKFTPQAQAVCSFSLADNRKWTDAQTNEVKEETQWYRVTVWGKQAEACNQYLKKGQQVAVSADRLALSQFTKKDGTPGASIEVTARHVQFLAKSTATEAPRPSQPTDDEIPF